MRYIAMRLDYTPPQSKPAGMNSIISVDEYDFTIDAINGMIPVPSKREKRMYYALYTFPKNYNKECSLVYSTQG